MGKFLLRRLAIAIPTLLLVSILVFLLQQLMPGDPAEALAGEERDPQVIAYLREKYRLNEPLPVQYLAWAGSVVTGDLGHSIRTKLPIGQMIVEKLPVTIELAILAMAVAIFLGIPLGVLAAVRQGTAWDHGVSVVALAGLSIPNFWLGIMLILVFAVQLGWLPSGGYVSPLDDLRGNLTAMLLPAIVLGKGYAAVLMRHTRSAMLDVLQQDYVRTARAKGVKERWVITVHAFRNALVPLVTLVTLQLGELLAGAVLTEKVFSLPGFGKLVVDAVFTRDYAVVQAVVLCTATAYLLLSILADLLYVVVNPRLRR